MADFHVTAERWKVRVHDGKEWAEYDIEAPDAEAARAEAEKKWAAREARYKHGEEPKDTKKK